MAGSNYFQKFKKFSHSNKTKFHINGLYVKKPSNSKFTHNKLPFLRPKFFLRSFVIGLEVVKTKPAAKNYLLCSTNDKGCNTH